MRVLVLGADGMLGHEVVSNLAADHEVHASVRRVPSPAVESALSGSTVRAGFDARTPGAVVPLLHDVRPDVVVNCVGIVKQRDEAKQAVESIRVNSLFPHELLEAVRLAESRLIHLSTDCVFSGEAGGYTEADTPDPKDLYGRSKLLGEVEASPGLTLRTSIIGLEFGRHSSLVEWFLRQRGTIQGFTNAIYSGVTTMEMARCIRMILTDQPGMSGVWQVASEPIDKYSLLVKLAAALDRSDVVVAPAADFRCDRSLSGLRFAETTGYSPPSWDDMLYELAGRIREREETTA